MTTLRISLFLAGIVPYAIAGGFTNDATVWPWLAGFLCQGAYCWSCCRTLKRDGKEFIF